MTELNKPLSRITRASRHEQGKTRPIVVTLDGRIIKLRLKGTRRSYDLDLESLYCQAVRSEVARQQREQRKGKSTTWAATVRPLLSNEGDERWNYPNN